jgi:Family of unknown function (DUF5681)
MDTTQAQTAGNAEAEPLDRSKYKGNRKPPPKDTRWKKGVSGNPGGKPRELKNAMQAARENSKYAMDALLDVVKNKQCSAAARVAAAGMILDRAYGRPPQLNTNVQLEYKRAIDMTDQELEAIIAGALDRSGMTPGELIEQAKQLASPSPSGASSVGTTWIRLRCSTSRPTKPIPPERGPSLQRPLFPYSSANRRSCQAVRHHARPGVQPCATIRKRRAATTATIVYRTLVRLRPSFSVARP